MPEDFKAVVIRRQEDKSTTAALETLSLGALPDEDVLVDVAYSSLNYKDGLAVTGKAPIVRLFPMVPGIDLAGTVLESRDPAYAPGDRVLATGWGLSEKYWGGYSQMQRLPAAYLTPVPAGFELSETMAIGTAGLTAMLCVMALADQGVQPDDGDILVTGAGGGVGSVAVMLLAQRGYRVVASTGRAALQDDLVSLGVADVIDREALATATGPLQEERWAGAIDVVGGTALANIIAQLKYGGAVAACGLAGGADLPSSVYPFIIRGVTLIGVDSVMCPASRRQQAWAHLEAELNMEKLRQVSHVAPLSEIQKWAEDIVAGRTHGRVIIDVKR